MDEGTAIDMIKNAPLACESCGSKKLLVFFERKIDKCFAYACWSCNNFQIYGVNKAQIDAWFKSHGY